MSLRWQAWLCLRFSSAPHSTVGLDVLETDEAANFLGRPSIHKARWWKETETSIEVDNGIGVDTVAEMAATENEHIQRKIVQSEDSSSIMAR